MKAALLASVLVGAAACSDAQWVFDSPEGGDAKVDAARAIDGGTEPEASVPPRPDASMAPEGNGFPDPDFDASRGFGGGFGRCATSQDCMYRTVTLYCNEMTNQCVECTADTQCGAALHVCDLAINRCVECNARSGCAAGEICAPMLHQCVAPCADGGASVCPPSAPYCVQQQGYCLGCYNDQQCNDSPVGHFCSPAGRCVQCFENDQCSDPRAPSCDLATNQCVECLMTSDCSGGVCDPTTKTCTGS